MAGITDIIKAQVCAHRPGLPRLLEGVEENRRWGEGGAVLTTVLTTLCSGGGREQGGWGGASYLGRRINGTNRVLPTTPTGPSSPSRGLGRFGATNIKYERHRMSTWSPFSFTVTRTGRLVLVFVLPSTALGSPIFSLCESSVLLLVDEAFLGSSKILEQPKGECQHIKPWGLFLFCLFFQILTPSIN